VGLDFKFKSQASLEEKVARDVHEANLMLLEALEKERMSDEAVLAVEKKKELDHLKLKRRSMTLLSTQADDEQSKAAVETTARKEAEALAKLHLERAQEAEKEFEAKTESVSNSVDVEAVVWSISDALRYTVLISTEGYTDAVKNALKRLEEQGMTPAKLKNYWGEGDGYQGINDVFNVPCDMSPTGYVKVEIQFHTPESFNHKMAVHGM
jgi:hypothetical protein